MTLDVTIEEAATAAKVTASFPNGKTISVKLPAYLEDGQDPQYVASELAQELAITASWLGLDGVAVTGKGDLAPQLKKSVSK